MPPLYLGKLHSACWPLAILATLCLGRLGSALADEPQWKDTFPAGGQIGNTLPVMLGGTFPNWPVRFWMDRPGLNVKCLDEKGKVEVAIDAQAIPGVFWLRAYDDSGASALKPFVVGALPEKLESEPNQDPNAMKATDLPVTINGRLEKAGDSDSFRVHLAEGETLVAGLQAHSMLGSPVDAIMQLCRLRVRDRREEAFVIDQSHDAHGLDPRIVYQADQTGDYLVRIFAFPSEPDSSIRFYGDSAAIYRLTMTTGPWVHHVWPMVWTDSKEQKLDPVGWNIPSREKLEWKLVEPESQLLDLDPQVTLARMEMAGGPCFFDQGESRALRADSQAALVLFGEPWPGAPHVFSIPGTIVGHFDSPDRTHECTFEIAKEVRLRIDVEGKSLGYQTIPSIQIFDSENALVFEQDYGPTTERRSRRSGGSPREFQSKSAGRYRLVVRERDQRHGPTVVYRMTIEAGTPDFAATVAKDRWSFDGDKPLEVEIQIDRKFGFALPIVFRAEGLPPAIAASEVRSEPQGDTSKSVKLTLPASQDAAAVQGTWQIVGRSQSDAPVVHRVQAGLPATTLGTSGQLWITRPVTKK